METEVTALRQNPDNTNNSILTDLASGSELLLLDELDIGMWYDMGLPKPIFQKMIPNLYGDLLITLMSYPLLPPKHTLWKC